MLLSQELTKGELLSVFSTSHFTNSRGSQYVKASTSVRIVSREGSSPQSVLLIIIQWVSN